MPGPAAYGRGGTAPTVTDANVVLGRLDSENFLGGGMSLDEVAARRVIGELARELEMSEREAAEGVVTVINANMANAIRSRTVQKGIDPRNYALVAFGGAGPLHGAEVAEMLGVPEVIVPPHPGITSAVGLLISDLRYDAIRTSFQVSGAADIARINADFAAMAKELADRFTADGIDLAKVTFERRGDLRYVGQGYELRVPFPDGTIDEAALAKAFAAFHEVHKREYGHHFAESAHRDREPAPGRRRRRRHDRQADGLGRQVARRGQGAHRPLHLPRRRPARRLSDRLLPPRPAAGRPEDRRPRHRAADGHHDRRAAAAQLRSRSAGNLIIAQGSPGNEHRANRLRSPTASTRSPRR